jgi:hypothetical protein
MDEFKNHHPVLELAWKRFAELNDNSMAHQDDYMKQRRLIIILAVVATFFAIIVDGYSDMIGAWKIAEFPIGTIIEWIFQLLLIMTPIVSSAIAAFSNKFQQGAKYLAMRGAAEEILKEVYLYRTVLQGEDDRHKWLNERLATIQRNMFKAVSGELVLKPYKGNVPPYYDPDPVNGYGDPGFTDLSGQEYLEFRLEDQLAWHIKKIQRLQVERKRIQIFLLLFGGLGALLAALGPGFSIWVALTSSLVAAYVGWEELRGLDLRVTNYSRVILELNLIRDYWMTLDEREKTSEEIVKLVRGTEKILWTQHSEFLKAMQEEFAETEGKEAQLIENVIQKSKESAEKLQEKIFAEAEGVVTEAIDSASERVALGVEDSAAEVTGGLARISEEVEDYYDKRAATLAAQAEARAQGYEEEVFDDEFYAEDDITAAVDAAISEASAMDNTAYAAEEYANEVQDVDDDDFEDEVFDDDYGDDDIFDSVSDDDDWDNVSGTSG